MFLVCLCFQYIIPHKKVQNKHSMCSVLFILISLLAAVLKSYSTSSGSMLKTCSALSITSYFCLYSLK